MWKSIEDYCKQRAELSRIKYLSKNSLGSAIYRARIEREEKLKTETRLYQLKSAIRCSYSSTKKAANKRGEIPVKTRENDDKRVDEMLSYLETGNKTEQFAELYEAELYEMEERYALYLT